MLRLWDKAPQRYGDNLSRLPQFAGWDEMIKTSVRYAFIALLIFAGGASAAEVKLKIAPSGVIDGDTFDAGDIRVRVLNINAPELGTMPGKYAYYHARKLLSGKEVTLIEELNHGPDRYKRHLFHVILPDGKNFGAEMIRRGFSKYWIKYGRSKIFDAEYQAAEDEAREKCHGLWKKLCNAGMKGK